METARGFTLIEVMIVMLIIAGVIAVGGVRLFNPNENRRAVVRQVAIHTKEMRTAARLQGATFRLVIDMDDEKGHRYWAESASGHVLQISSADQEELSRLTQAQREAAIGKQAQFERDPKIKETRLPRGLFFEGVEVVGREREMTEGLATIHFFPQGLSDEAVIKMGDRKTQHWTIAINPVTGRAQILSRAVGLRELKGL